MVQNRWGSAGVHGWLWALGFTQYPATGPWGFQARVHLFRLPWGRTDTCTGEAGPFRVSHTPVGLSCWVSSFLLWQWVQVLAHVHSAEFRSCNSSFLRFGGPVWQVNPLGLLSFFVCAHPPPLLQIPRPDSLCWVGPRLKSPHCLITNASLLRISSCGTCPWCQLAPLLSLVLSFVDSFRCSRHLPGV